MYACMPMPEASLPSLCTRLSPSAMVSPPPSIEGIPPSQHVHDVPDDKENVPAVKDARQWDPNLSQEKVEVIHEESKTDDQEAAVEFDKPLEQDSPYEAVRAAVRNTDNGEVANTVRAWVLGTFFVTVGSGLNMFLSMRSVLFPTSSAFIESLTGTGQESDDFHPGNRDPITGIPDWVSMGQGDAHKGIQHIRPALDAQYWPVYHKGAYGHYGMPTRSSRLQRR